MRNTVIVTIMCALPLPLAAQVGVPQSTRYHTVATGSDVSVSWTNPAGLATAAEASVMAEFRYDRLSAGGGRVGQFSLGLNSRGFSIVYQRDRFQNGNSGSTFRLGVGNAFSSGAVGIAYTVYRGSGPSADGFDAGVRFHLSSLFEAGAVMHNFTRPFVRGVRLPVTGVAALAVTPSPNIRLSAEATGAERFGTSGLDLSYRGLITVWSPSRKASLVGVVDINSDISVTTVGFGFSYGGTNQGLAFATLDRTGGSARLNSVSLTGVARNALRPRGRR